MINSTKNINTEKLESPKFDLVYRMAETLRERYDYISKLDAFFFLKEQNYPVNLKAYKEAYILAYE